VRGAGASRVESGRELSEAACEFEHNALGDRVGGNGESAEGGEQEFGVLRFDLVHEFAELVFESKREE